MARPLLQIDEVLLEDLASIGCTTDEMSSMLDCSGDTLERRFAGTIQKGRSRMKMSLRRTQIRLAEAGNAALAIWLGKQYLDQREPSQTLRIEDVDRVLDEAAKTHGLPLPVDTQNHYDKPVS